jgi:hypothetical protein
MDLSFHPLTLEAIDQAAAESLCLFIGSDERPLTGLAGLLDWRLSGKLSRLLRGGLLTGEAGEAVLTPPGTRFGFQKLFLFGVGPSGQPEQLLVERVGEALRKLAQAGVREVAMQLPARLAPELGVRTLLDVLQGPARAVVFAADPQKLMMALSQVASRGQPQVEQRVVKVPTPAQVKPVPPAPRPPPPQRYTPTAILKASPPPAPDAASPPPAPDAASPPPAEPAAAAPLLVEAAAPHPPAEGAAPPPAEAPAQEEKRPPPGPSQRYIPPPPKPHVFDRKRKKH